MQPSDTQHPTLDAREVCEPYSDTQPPTLNAREVCEPSTDTQPQTMSVDISSSVKIHLLAYLLTEAFKKGDQFKEDAKIVQSTQPQNTTTTQPQSTQPQSSTTTQPPETQPSENLVDLLKEKGVLDDPMEPIDEDPIDSIDVGKVPMHSVNLKVFDSEDDTLDRIDEEEKLKEEARMRGEKCKGNLPNVVGATNITINNCPNETLKKAILERIQQIMAKEFHLKNIVSK